MPISFIRSPNLYKSLGVGLVLTAVLATISLIFFDQQVAQFSGSPEHFKFWLFNREITEIGRSDGYFILTVLILFVTFFGRRSKSLSEIVRARILRWYQWSLAFIISMLGCGAVLHIVKFCVGRLRPHKSPDSYPLHFDFFTPHWDWGSFPSGHSQTLFTAATMISLMFPRLIVPVYILATYLSLTRAFTDAHFTSDVIFGAYLGFSVTVLILRYLDRKSVINLNLFERKQTM